MRTIAVLSMTVVLGGSAMAVVPPGYIAWDLDGNNDGVISSGTYDMHGTLYVPSNYDSSKKYPVVTMLHGMGGGGWDDRHIDATLDPLKNHASSVGYIMFAPESPTNNNDQWSASNLTKVMTLLERVGQSYSVDPKRLYVTGCSNGGGGVYSIVSQNPGKFAAAVPIAGVSPSGVSNTVLSKTPMWIFHGDNDSSVKVSNSRNRIDGIRAAKNESPLSYPPKYTSSSDYWVGTDLASGAPYYADRKAGYFKEPDGMLQYSEYRGWGHVIWPYVWAEEPLYTWMFQQSVPEPTSVTMVTVGGLAALSRRRRAV